MAAGALRELRERGLRVPEDVSVAGFDDVTLAQFCHPPLTSVHIPRDTIGQTICNVLMPCEGARPEHEFVLDPELVVRGSTGPPPRRRPG
jgi:DNA-binding LacI/PurR family transcriptional regulator